LATAVNADRKAVGAAVFRVENALFRGREAVGRSSRAPLGRLYPLAAS